MGQDSFTDMCNLNKNCREEDIHTDVTKFGTYCEYMHIKNKETKLQKDIQ